MATIKYEGEIYFKSGAILDVTAELVTMLAEKIKEGYTGVNVFTDKKGDAILIINISEIVYVAAI